MKTVVVTAKKEHSDKYCYCSYRSGKTAYLTENTVYLNR